MKKCMPLIIFLLISLAAFSQAWKTYPYAPAGSFINFPVDEGRHASEPVEWWYTMGYLTGSTTGNHYSYMISYFYYPESIFDGFRIFNISDDELGLFYSEALPLTYNILATDQLNIEANIISGGTEVWRNKTDALDDPIPFEYELSATSANGILTLTYDAIKPPLILADSGLLNQGDTDYSYYYSQTGNAVIGTITFNGTSENVTGTSWIDRQYGTFNPVNGHEYEWFCIQLSNGMDFNIYNIYTSSYKIPNNLRYRLFSAYLDENTQSTTSGFEIERLAFSFMPDMERCYSQKWRITCPVLDVDIVVTTLHPYYEVSLPFRFYEGPVNITGTVDGSSVTGAGFAELVHSYEQPDIQLTSDGFNGEGAILLTWQNSNPDDGNPLLYDLEYKIGYKGDFVPIIRQITDTFYTWNPVGLSDQTNIRIKVTGYSVDSTLSDFSIITLNPNAVERIEKKALLIYPNPSKGEFTVEGNAIHKIEIYNISGNLIYTSIPGDSKHSVSLYAQPKGIYFVKIIIGNRITTERIIIE